MKSILLLVIVLCTVRTYAQEFGDRLLDPCISRTTCHECIQAPTCAWCLNPNFQDERCFQNESPLDSCGLEFVYYPYNELQQIRRDVLSQPRSISEVDTSGRPRASGSWRSSASRSSPSSSSSSRASKIIQIAPQHTKLKLRINEPLKFNMIYGEVEDFPVDLYYLVDHRKSMIDDKYAVAKLADLLVDSMGNITSNLRLGFGSFVSKGPCENCETPHEFRNHMSLSSNLKEFSRLVKTTTVSENLDALEGGSDAIMQAIVCHNEIGWRKNAKKILVFVSDAGLNYAKDEKLDSSITPNDGLCHLDNKYYNHSEVQSSPNIFQINQKVNENGVNIIFAVTEDQISNYKQLQQHIEGASIGKLSEDSSNIVDLIKEQYQQISSTVEMKDNATSEITINYYSTCLNANGTLKQANKCENLKVGDVVEFTVKIKVTACPKDPKDWKQTLQIYPVGVNENLVVDLEMLCSCPCEHPEHSTYNEKSPHCFGGGTYKCGICECDSKFFGKRCECSATETFEIDKIQNCRIDNVTQVDCSGEGECVCGHCKCYARENNQEVVSGKYCECDNFSCDRHDGKLCSGVDHGTCVCGACQCVSPWTGPACNCSASNDTCYSPNLENAEMCSGHGKCVCGQCECEATGNELYSGKYCEKLPESSIIIQI